MQEHPDSSHRSGSKCHQGKLRHENKVLGIMHVRRLFLTLRGSLQSVGSITANKLSSKLCVCKKEGREGGREGGQSGRASGL